MKRYPLKWRMNTYQECEFYRLSMIARKPVAPGERYSKVVVDTRFNTPVFSNVSLTPILAQTWLFYVPNRLVWDQWVDFIAQDDAVPSVPTSTNAQAIYFDGTTSAQRTMLPRRAYKLIYNQYFGDESAPQSECWFPNVADDATNFNGKLLIWDQLRSKLRQRLYDSQTFSAGVTGGNAVINLDDLARALRDNRARRRQKSTGDKYVDTMRLMGVELDWRIQMAPEFLGSSQQVVFPRERNSTTATDLGARAFSWEGQQQLVLKRRVAFAEHGYLIALAGFRPLMSVQAAAVDANDTTLDSIFRPDTSGAPGVLTPGSTGGTTVMAERDNKYLYGRNTCGLNANGWAVLETGSSSVTYPTCLLTPIAGSGTSAVGMLSDISVGGLTPVPAGRV